MKLNSKGFGLVGYLAVIAFIAVTVAGGWTIYHHDHKKVTTEKNSHTTSQQKANNSSKITATPTIKPILGESWAPSQEGYGTSRPSTINNGGDPTGIVTDVIWQSWGSSKATATGTSTYVPADSDVAHGTQAKATVVAFNLSTCQGKVAYTAIEWYFPQYGGSFNPDHYRNICTGQEVGQ